MRQLAVGPVELAPLVEQRESAAGSAGIPAVRTNLAELKRSASVADRPAGVNGDVEQIEQARLGGRVHPVWDPAT